MFRSSLKIAFRNILKHKVFTVINISGLTISFVSFLFIVFYITDELSYDQYHTKSGIIYRACRLLTTNGLYENSATCSFPFSTALEQDYPDMVDRTVRFFNFQRPKLLIEYGEKKFNEEHFFFVDSTVFDVFDFQLLRGNPQTALDNPNTIVITESMASKYFGEEDPIGKTLILEEQGNFEVTGILKDIPNQTHLHFDFLASFSTMKALFGGQYPQTWIWNPCWTYVLLKDGVTREMLEAKLPDFYTRHYNDFQNEEIKLWLQPLRDIHLKSNIEYEISQNNNITYIYILSAIALFILIIACINFMNLTTANSACRVKEIGVKKIFGAPKKYLVGQFLGESLILSFIAMILAIVCIELLLPYFNDFASKDFEPSFLFNPGIILWFVLLAVFTGLFAGVYPAFFLSSFKPLVVLKSTLSQGAKSVYIRKILVVAQFTISIALIIGTIVVIAQINSLRSANLGFKKDQIICFSTTNQILRQYQTFIDELKSSPDINNATGMEYVLGEDHNTWAFNIEGLDPDKTFFHPALMVRHGFVETFNIEVVAGRTFSENILTDTSEAVMISESMARKFGWSNEESIGKKFSNDRNEKVIGVFKDINALSLHKPTDELVLDMLAGPGSAAQYTRYIAVRTSTDNYQGAIDFLEKKWNEFAPTRPFEYFFLDKRLDQLYKNEDKFGKLGIALTALTIFIACLGLFGLTSYLVEQRTKEIGIRRVLGASFGTVVKLLSKEFLILLIFSNIVAWPIAYFSLNRWLQTFVVQTNISILYFVATGIFSIALALLIIGYKSLVANRINPAEVLKSE